MVEIYLDGSGFEDICHNASLIHDFKRDSYALSIRKGDKRIIVIAPMNGIIHVFGDMDILEYAMDTMWYMNLKIGGISSKKEIAKEACHIFEKEYQGTTRLLSSEGDMVSYLFTESGRKRALFAGGCFWCISAPFYEIPGVLSVKSGYAGGKELNPKYLDVKAQLTNHKECILIEYNGIQVDYELILEVYFENIDPFDTEGQFIDRGNSYAPAIFTSDKYERDRVIEYKYQLSDECERLCTVPLLDNAVFFLAEEEHQDFAIKHPDLLLKELVESGRKPR